MLPGGVLLHEEVAKVSLEGSHGAFTMLPRHIDFVSDVVPCIMIYVPLAGEEQFLALEEGVVVKRGDEVMISVRGALRGEELGQLTERLVENEEELVEREKEARSALARLESHLVRSFVEAGELH
jgi:F-type H+-transporting ATPase subunit epsilon